MSLPEILTIVAVALWSIAIVTVFRPVVKGWRVNKNLPAPVLDEPAVPGVEPLVCGSEARESNEISRPATAAISDCRTLAAGNSISTLAKWLAFHRSVKRI